MKIDLSLSSRALIATAGLALAAPSFAGVYSLNRVSRIASPDGAEISAVDTVSRRVFTTGFSGVTYFNIGAGGALSAGGFIDLSGVFPSVDSIASVAVDPLGRGFGVAGVIPSDNTATRGKLVAFNLSTGAILNTFDVGFNPDNVTFTNDGSRILIADEGESSGAGDPVGGMTVIDVSGVTGVGNVGNGVATTYDFLNDLAPGVSLAGIRPTFEGAGVIELGLEPEYIAADSTGAWITLQENNAVARFDFATNSFTEVRDLGTIVQTIDASDRDGGAFIDDTVRGLFLPDAIASYEVAGQQFYLTANEGDARGEELRFKDAVADGLIDPTYLASLNSMYGGNAAADAALGRLDISTIDGDYDNDGDIDEIHMYGTRSFTIFNADSGDVVFDSGSDFETITRDTLPAGFFNSQGDPGSFDSRSDNKGPEPEGLTLGVIDGHTFAFIALERVGGVMMYDITDPNNVMFVDYLNTATESDGGTSPEGLDFFELDGEYFLAVSYEVSQTVEIFQIVPAPAVASLFGLAGIAAIRRRR
jgi:hypothetical protein